MIHCSSDCDGQALLGIRGASALRSEAGVRVAVLQRRSGCHANDQPGTWGSEKRMRAHLGWHDWVAMYTNKEPVDQQMCCQEGCDICKRKYCVHDACCLVLVPTAVHRGAAGNRKKDQASQGKRGGYSQQAPYPGCCPGRRGSFCYLDCLLQPLVDHPLLPPRCVVCLHVRQHKCIAHTRQCLGPTTTARAASDRLLIMDEI